MARCDVCGNDYRRTMEIRYQNSVGTLLLRPLRRNGWRSR